MASIIQDVVWAPGLPPQGRFDVTLDRDGDAWIFRELADVVDPAPWMVDIRAAYVDMSSSIQTSMRDPEGVVPVTFEVRYNQQDPLLSILQALPSKLIVGLAPFVAPKAPAAP